MPEVRPASAVTEADYRWFARCEILTSLRLSFGQYNFVYICERLQGESGERALSSTVSEGSGCK